jgi:hypothetical protein
MAATRGKAKESLVTIHLRGVAPVVTLLAVAAAAVPAAASARTRWFYERQPIPEGTTVKTAAYGPIKLKLKQPKKTGIEISCNASGVVALWNSPKNGLDQARSINFSCTAPCGKVVITPRLPWSSILTGSALPLTDEWSGVALKATCGGTDYGVFSGTLTPTMGDGDPQAGVNDDLDTELRFHGEKLAGPNSSTLSFNGFYHLGPSRGHGATGEL